MSWLITGGAGYIGSHLVSALNSNGFETIVLDDLSTGDPEKIPPEIELIVGDILDTNLVHSILAKKKISGVIHLAAKKNVIESFEKSDQYFEVNTEGTKQLLDACKDSSVSKFIFSSTAAVYKQPKLGQKLNEKSLVSPISPYGESKLMAENALRKLDHGNLKTAVLRFFNVTGASHPSLEEIDAPNLVPVLRRAILNNQPIEIFGSSHPTRDGTCERDYIHVLDIVDAHLELIKHFDKLVDGKHETFNLGTGKGYTVLEVIANFEVLWSTKIKKSFTNQRLGEPPSVVCDATYVKNVLGWEATRNPFTGGLDS